MVLYCSNSEALSFIFLIMIILEAHSNIFDLRIECKTRSKLIKKLRWIKKMYMNQFNKNEQLILKNRFNSKSYKEDILKGKFLNINITHGS